MPNVLLTDVGVSKTKHFVSLLVLVPVCFLIVIVAVLEFVS